jgi:2,4-dienoyl-CoA reductase (NADPH2)
MKKLRIDVRLHKEFDASALDSLKPDVVVLAAGGLPTLPEVPGIERRNVIKTSDLYGILKFFIRLVGPKWLGELTKIWMPVGKRVVIIGGAIQGCQLGEYLTKRGRKVTIVETGDEMGKWLVPEKKTRLFYWFDRKGVERLRGVKLVEITKEGLTIVTKEGETRLLEADNVMPVLPFSSNKAMLETLRKKVPEVYAIGDCDEAGVIPDATAAGWRIGNAI